MYAVARARGTVVRKIIVIAFGAWALENSVQLTRSHRRLKPKGLSAALAHRAHNLNGDTSHATSKAVTEWLIMQSSLERTASLQHSPTYVTYPARHQVSALWSAVHRAGRGAPHISPSLTEGPCGFLQLAPGHSRWRIRLAAPQDWGVSPGQ
jgi:hypothetical protein